MKLIMPEYLTIRGVALKFILKKPSIIHHGDLQTPLPHAVELGNTSLMFLVHPTLTSSEIELTCEVARKGPD